MTGVTDSETGLAMPNLLSGLRLDELLREVQDRLAEIVATRDRMQGLLDAVLAIGDGSGARHHPAAHRGRPPSTSSRPATARSACSARDGGLSRFLYVGIDEETRARDGPAARGQGPARAAHRRPASAARWPTSAPTRPRSGSRRTTRRCGAFLGVPVRVRDAVFGNLYLTEKAGGGEFTAADEVVVEALAAAAGIAVQNADLFEQTRLRQRWLEATAEIRDELLSGRERRGRAAAHRAADAGAHPVGRRR